MSTLKAATLWLIMCSCVVSGCATKADISLVDVYEVQTIEARYEPVATIPINGRDRGSAYWIVSVRANADLAGIVHARRMAFLYYRLQHCDADERTGDWLSGDVYVNTQAPHADPDDAIYFAAIPTDFRAAIQRYSSMMGTNSDFEDNNICIALGAGNMLGQYISTNFVKINLQ